MGGALDTYYRDHWLHVEAERLARYEAMFQWRDGLDALIAPADIRAGQTVADFGCGPGGLTLELARRVGAAGRVLALDINADFLDRTRALAADAGVAAQVEPRLLQDERIPADDGSFDRLVCKNVLEYVADPAASIAEFHRVLKPGGLAHVTDSDWAGAVLEPLGEGFERLMAAAAIAFRTPGIARQAYGMFRRAGFRDIQVRVLANADTSGAMAGVWRNMAGYARTSGRLDEAEIAAFEDGLERAIEAHSYLAVLPQFLITGRR